jgi:hypothetical protein
MLFRALVPEDDERFQTKFFLAWSPTSPSHLLSSSYNRILTENKSWSPCSKKSRTKRRPPIPWRNYWRDWRDFRYSSVVPLLSKLTSNLERVTCFTDFTESKKFLNDRLKYIKNSSLLLRICSNAKKLRI